MPLEADNITRLINEAIGEKMRLETFIIAPATVNIEGPQRYF